MPYAGYNAKILILEGGTATVFTGEAMTGSGAGPYTITNSVKSIWSPEHNLTFYDNGVVINAADIASVDLLFGRVTFTGSKTGPITVDGRYLILYEIPEVTECSFELSRDVLDVTVFQDTSRQRTMGLIEASGSFHILDTLDTDIDTTASERKIYDTLIADDVVILALVPGVGTAPKYRMYARLTTASQELTVDGLLEGDIEFQSTAVTTSQGFTSSVSVVE